MENVDRKFGPKFKHMAGPENIVADTVSRIDMEHRNKDEIDTGDETIQLSYMTAEEAIAEEFPMNAN